MMQKILVKYFSDVFSKVSVAAWDAYGFENLSRNKML